MGLKEFLILIEGIGKKWFFIWFIDSKVKSFVVFFYVGRWDVVGYISF